MQILEQNGTGRSNICFNIRTEDLKDIHVGGTSHGSTRRKVYAKQNLDDDRIIVTDMIKEKINERDNYFTDRIMRFGEGLRGSRQFWNARRDEVSDMVKQLGSQ